MKTLIFCWNCLCFGYYVNTTYRDVMNGFGDKEGSDEGYTEYTCYECQSYHLVKTKVEDEEIIELLEKVYTEYDGEYFNPIPAILLFMAAYGKLTLQKFSSITPTTTLSDFSAEHAGGSTMSKDEIFERIKQLIDCEDERVVEALRYVSKHSKLRDVLAPIERFKKKLLANLV